MDNPLFIKLFGKISFEDLTTGLEKEIDDMLWELKPNLGPILYAAINRKPRPVAALVRTIDERRRDTALATAFEEFVLKSEGLYFMLKPEAQLEAQKRKPPSVNAEGFSVPAGLPGVAEISTAEELAEIRDKARQQKKVPVVLFVFSPSFPVSQSFSIELTGLIRCDEKVDLFIVDLVKPDARSLQTKFDIMNVPSTLIFSPHGHSMVVGANSSRIQQYISQAKSDCGPENAGPVALPIFHVTEISRPNQLQGRGGFA